MNPRPRHATLRKVDVAVLAAFGLLLTVAIVRWRMPAWVAGFYLATSVGCAVAYFVDKSAAMHRRHRVSARTLIVLGLLGGWPGGIVARRTMHHKTAKASFRTMFNASVVLNIAGFLGLAWLRTGPHR